MTVSFLFGKNFPHVKILRINDSFWLWLTRSLKSVLVLQPQIFCPFGPPKKSVNFNKFNQRHNYVIFLSLIWLLNIFLSLQFFVFSALWSPHSFELPSFLISKLFGPPKMSLVLRPWSPRSLILRTGIQRSCLHTCLLPKNHSTSRKSNSPTQVHQQLFIPKSTINFQGPPPKLFN